MKRIYTNLGIIFIIFLVACSSENKEIIETFDDGSPKIIRYFDGKGKGKKKIIEQVFWENGILKKNIKYDGNLKEGEYLTYYDNSALESQKYYKANREVGVQKYWHKNGQLKYEYNTINGQISGKKVIMFEDGTREEERYYTDGKEDGLQIGWHDNGSKHFEYTSIKGLKNGLFSLWFRNGQKEIELSCVNDTVDGHLTAWYMNGNKRLEFNFKNFKFEGAQKSWDGDGNLIYHFENYLQESPEGKQQVYFGNYETWLSDHWELIKYVFDKWGLVSAIK